MATDLPELSGLLAIDKPLHLTSRDCVNRVDRVLRERFPKPLKRPKAGHAGTLDPLASGVLVVGIGSGVRLVPYIQQMLKCYAATFRFGCWTASGDLDGELQTEVDPQPPTRERLERATQQLTGDITQTPPATSAIKIAGQAAYKYAHQGIEVTVPSRIVHIASIQIDRYDYPEVDVTVVCGSGTYMRSLGMDLAALCGTRAVMTQLRRTAIGSFTLDRCVSLEQLTAETLDQALLPLADGVVHLPTCSLPETLIERLANGQRLVLDPDQLQYQMNRPAAVKPLQQERLAEKPVDEERVVIDSQGRLRAIIRQQGNAWSPYRVFHHRVS